MAWVFRTAAAGIVLAGMGAGCGGDDGGPGGGGGDAGMTPDASMPDAPVGGDTGGTGGSDTGAASDDGALDSAVMPGMAVAVTVDVTADATWEAQNTYRLTKHIFVRAPAVLTIQPGTVIKGDLGSSLVITQGAKIMADGSAAKPIIFTSGKDAGMRRAADWGGVVILGRAPINASSGSQEIEGFASGTPGIVYGGTDPNDNSGVFRYVRIEFAGFELSPMKELNGLTLGGVGSATTVDYVQSHRGADDGVEVFGGTVNLKHIVISQADDDGLDWDFGWVGKVQYLIIQQNNAVGDSGMECDNHPTNLDVTPRSMPTIYNASLVGSSSTVKPQRGAVLRNGTAGRLNNFIITHFPITAVDVRTPASVAQTATVPRNLTVEGSIFFKNAAADVNFAVEAAGTSADNDAGFDEAAFFTTGTPSNRVVDPMLTDAQKQDGPSFLPMAGSPALTGAVATPAGDAFFDTATFVGAMGTVDWTATWTAYPQN